MDSTAEKMMRPRSYEGTLIRALLVVTVAVFAQTLVFDFVFWDDNAYVYGNPDITYVTLGGIKRAFTSLTMSHWHPVTTLSHMADAALFGMNPGAHHAVNLCLHLANTVLLFLLLRRTTRSPWPSAFVAAVFAVHPLHVENVVWISDRKDLLSTFFGFLALHAYLRYLDARRIVWYLSLTVLFCLAFLSKSMLITLPLMCLLLDYWPLQRVRRSPGNLAVPFDSGGPTAAPRTAFGLIVEKAPLFVCVLLFGAATVAALRRSILIEYAGELPWHLCLVNAVASYGWYIIKTIWPSRLAVEYVHPYLPGGTPWTLGHIVGAGMLLLAVSGAVWRLRRPYLVMGWLWFLGTLLPVSGVLQLGKHGRADRYMYVPMIGLLIMAAWSAADVLQHLTIHRKLATRIPAATAVLAIGACALASFFQARYWRDPMTFLQYQLSVVPDNPYLNTNLGILFERQGEVELAVRHGERAIAVHPGCFEAHELLSRVLEKQGRHESARKHRETADHIIKTLRQAHFSSRSS